VIRKGDLPLTSGDAWLSAIARLTFSLRRPITQAYKLPQRLLVDAWRAVESVPVRWVGTGYVPDRFHAVEARPHCRTPDNRQ
jgi:hypothetical protein